MAELSQEAVAQEEQTQQSTQVATDPEAGMSTEEKLLKRSDEIKKVLDSIQKEEIDPSLYTDILESFTDEKKEELQAIVEEVNDPLGKKTITLSTIDTHYTYAPIVYQEVWMKDGVITKYGSFFLKGFVDDYDLGLAEGSHHIALPLPNDVEFDFLWINSHSFFARPKAGQSNVGGVSGSLDNTLFCFGNGATGTLGNGSTAKVETPYIHSFTSRVKKMIVYTHGDNANSGAFCLLENGDLYVSGSQPNGIFGLGNTTQVNTWTKTKSDVINIFSGSTTAFCITGDGTLYGAGYNGAYNIISQTTSNQTTLIRVTDGLGNPLETPEGTKFVMHPLETIILIPNGGNMDLYTGGNGIYGHGDSRSGSQKLAKVKTFEGNDWEILTNFSPCSYGDQIECFVIYSKSRQEAWAWGSNSNGKLGVASLGDKKTMMQVMLPFKGSRFELQFQFSGGTDEGGLVCIVDDTLYAVGYSGYNRLLANTAVFSQVSTH